MGTFRLVRVIYTREHPVFSASVQGFRTALVRPGLRLSPDVTSAERLASDGTCEGWRPRGFPPPSFVIPTYGKNASLASVSSSIALGLSLLIVGLILMSVQRMAADVGDTAVSMSTSIGTSSRPGGAGAGGGGPAGNLAPTGDKLRYVVLGDSSPVVVVDTRWAPWNATGSEVKVASISDPRNGSAERIADGFAVTYKPRASYLGPDAFVVFLWDGAASRSLDIEINVIAPPGVLGRQPDVSSGP